MKFLSDILAKAGLVVDGTVTLNSVANTSTSTGKFVVIDTNVVKYRTAAQVLSEIGAQPAGSYLTSESDTLATVTARGATTSIVVSFTGGDANNSSVKLSGYNQRGGVGYHGFLEVTSTYGTVTNPNKYFRLDSVGSLQIINSGYTAAIFSLTDAGALSVTSSVTAGSFVKSGGTSSQFLKADGSVDSSTYATQTYVGTQIANLVASAPAALDTLNELAAALGNDANFSTTVTNSLAGKVPTTRTITINGTAYDLSADRSWTITAGVSSVNAGTGVSVNSTTGAVTVSIGQSVATSAQVTFDSVLSTNNGNGTNYKVGDDAWIGDINLANTIRITGVQDGTQGYIVFGNSNGTALGRSGTGALTYGGNTVYHAGNLTNLNQLTNGPGYITGNQTITLSGDASGSGTTAITVTLANSGVTAGTYNNVTVDAKGRVTSATNVSYQSPLTNPITGTGTTGTLPKFSSSTGLTDSIIREISSSRLLIGTGTVDDTLSTIQTNGQMKAVHLILDGAVSNNTNLWIKSVTGYIGQIIYMNNSNMTFALRDNGTNWDVYSYVSGNTGQKFIVYASGTVKLPGYTSNGFLKTSASDGTLVVDTNSYLTGNQTITLTGHITGSGTTSIATTIANGVVTNAMLVNSSFNIGTTSISLGRASASQTLTGVSIDGNSATTSQTNFSSLTVNSNSVLHAGNFTSYTIRWNSTSNYGSGLDNTTVVPNSVTLFDGYSAAVPGYPTAPNQWWVGALTIGDANRGFQIAGGYADADMYFRKGATTWGSWKKVWTDANLTNLNQLTNGPGYITSYTETDTLATVTGRGASTSTAVTFNGGVTATQYALTGGFTISNASSYGQTSTWLGMSGHGIYTTSVTYIDLDGSSSTVSVRGYNNDDFAVFANTGTANTSRLIYFLPNGGNFAVGLSNPSSGDKVEIAGTLRVHTGNNWDAIQIYTDGANGYIQGLGDETGLRIRSQYGNIILADDRGNVGVGTTSPGGKFHTVGDVISQTSLNIVGQFWFNSRKSRGTADAPTSVLVGDDAGGILFSGYDGSTWRSGAGILAKVQAVSVGSLSSNLQLYAGNGSVSGATLRMILRGDTGNVLINQTTDNGTDRLQVTGTAIFTSSVTASSFIKSGGTSAQFLMADGSVSTNPGWITSYTETDTLATVTARGATTSSKVFFTYNTAADPLSAVEINGGGTHTGLYINPAASSQAHVRFGTNGTLKWQIRVPFQDSANTDLKIYSWVNGADQFLFNHNGNLTIAGTLTEQSALRYKENIAPVTAALDKVDQLKPVSYNKKGSTTKEIGLIAEDVFDVYPEFVLCDDNGEPVGIHYSRLTAVLIESVKELKNRITELENRN